MSRARRLLDAARDAREEAADVRFVREVGDGSLTPATWAAYLEIEHGFVGTAMRLHGTALAAAPTWAAACRHARAAHALATEQEDFFVRARAASPVPSPLSDDGRARAAQLAAATGEVAAEGGYAGVVTGLFAAESLYRTWCARSRPPEPGPVRDWVALHTAPTFLAGVDALAAEVDALPPEVPDADLERWYRRVLAAEIAFHDAVYAEDTVVRRPGN